MHIFKITIKDTDIVNLDNCSSAIEEHIMWERRDDSTITAFIGISAFNIFFAETCTFIRKMCAMNLLFIEYNGQATSVPFVLAFLDRLEELEQQLKQDKQVSDNQQEGWGYAVLDAINRYLPESKDTWFLKKYWFHFGSFVSDGLWRVDKNQIKAILKQQAEDIGLHLCPSFDFSKTEGIIDRLPDHIDARENPNWSVLSVPEMVGSRVLMQPIGVIHKLSQQKALILENATGEILSERKRNIPKITFNDIGGIDSILTHVREVVELPLKNPGIFKHLGIKPHKGVLLYGAPGCGKTMIAKAIANEVQAHFIAVKGPELINKYYGQSEENLRKLFKEAREMEPTILFFDEIDAVAQRRSGADNLRMDARFVNQLLSLMDGIEDFGRVCVLGATNRIELIDGALLRPGRFDYHLEVQRPDAKGCLKILEITTQKMPLAEHLDLMEISTKLMGGTGADIAFVAREAAFNSLRRNLDLNGSFNPDVVASFEYENIKIESSDFEKALEKLHRNSVEQ